MNVTFLNLLGQLVSDAGAGAWLILKTVWAAACVVFGWMLMFVAKGAFYLIVGAVAMGMVWFSMGCVPTAYMAYKGQPKQEPVVVEEPSDDAQGLLETLLKYDCVPAWFFIEKTGPKTTVAQGCQKNDHDILPRLLAR